jgi:subtilisin family serine protease
VKLRSALLPFFVSMMQAGCSEEFDPSPAWGPDDSDVDSTGLHDKAAPDEHPLFVPGRVIVKFRDTAGQPPVASSIIAGEHPARVTGALPGGAVLLELGTDADVLGANLTLEERTLEAIEALRKRDDVEYAHEDLLMEFFATPGDPLYPQQWSYPAIMLPQAWDVVTGNTIIAVLDSGKLPHPDLGTKWLTGHDFGDNDADATDAGLWHHGVHVAGILAGKVNNGLGGAGICWGCSLLPVKVTGAQGLTMTSVTNAIIWAGQQGAKVINMSFGTTGNAPCSQYPLLQNAIDQVAQNGVVLVAAAGNDGADTSNVTPASCANVIAVAASDQSGNLASYSNRGARVDITAPGGGTPQYGQGVACPPDPTYPTYQGTAGVLASWAISKPSAQLQAADYCHRYLSGTSMAAPHLAGVAALVLSRNPLLTSTQVRQIIRQAQPIPVSCGANQCGTGLVNAYAAVQAAQFNFTVSCESGTSHFTCDATLAGGVAPYNGQWQGVAYATVSTSTPGYASGICTANQTARINVTLTDAIGRPVTKQVSFLCRSGPWQ